MKIKKKENLKTNKGITLIALAITIIVLLILAGVTIATLTGENGILSKAQTAKKQTEYENVKEQVKLAVLASRMNDKNDASIDEVILESELGNYEIDIISKDGENGKLPWTVKNNGYVFTISATGEVKEKVGITITTGDIEILIGSTEGKTITAQLLNGETGTIKWSSTGNITLSETTGETTTVTLGNNANVGDTAKIKAQIEGKDHEDSINVKVVTQTTGLTIEPVTVGVGKKATIGKVTTVPENAEEVEITSYTSENPNVATVSEKGEIIGVTAGSTTATITVTGKGKLSGATVSGTCIVTVEKSLVSVTAEQIAANPKEYYGKEVLNYKASESDTNTYRIFYVDTDNCFEDGKNTIYLKADYSVTGYTLNPSYDLTNTKVRTMNPLWAAQRGTATWNANEKSAAYLCLPINESNYTTSSLPWNSYYKTNDANVNYVIGGPSIEMYVKSYNQTHDKDASGNDALGCKIQTENVPGYGYKFFGSMIDDGYSTSFYSLDYSNKYNSMYCGKGGSKVNGQWWLASPNARTSDHLCTVECYNAKLESDGYYYNYNQLSPLVSLKSNFTPQIEK